MNFKSLIFGCTVLSFWPWAAKCESDAPLKMSETNLEVSSEPEFVSAHERYAENDDIDHVKPVLSNADISARDYQKFRTEPHRSPHRSSYVNVNVNHHDSSKSRWNKKQSKRLNRQPDVQQRDDYQNKRNQILEMMSMLPNFNVDYNLAHPLSDISVRKKKYSKHETLRNSPEAGSDEFASIEEDDNNQCHSIVHKALEYLRRVEINLRNLDGDLRALIGVSHEKGSHEESTELESK